MNKYEKYIKDRKTNRIIAIILIVLITILLFLEVYRIFYSDAYYEEVLDYIEVPVLNVNKNQREIIKESDIVYKRIPSSYLSEDVILDRKKLTNQYIKLGNSINSYMPVTYDQLETGNSFSDYGNLLLNDKQIVFPIDVNLLASSGNNIKSSMNVDIYLTVKTEEGYISDLLIKNVRVIDVKNTEGESINKEDDNFVPYIVLLAVNQEHISLLNVAKRTGDIELYISDDSYNLKKESILNNNSEIIIYITN